MTVGELRSILAQYGDTLPVIIAKDLEGNDYSPLSEHTYGRYIARNSWSGEVITDLSGEEGFEKYKKSTHVCVLWPTN